MKRRNFLNAASAGMTASMLAACGGGDESVDLQQAQAFEQANDAKRTPVTVPAGPIKSRVIVVGGAWVAQQSLNTSGCGVTGLR